MAGKKNKSKKTEDSLLTPPGSAVKMPPTEADVDSGAMQIDDEELKVYLPGMSLAEGEVLEVDPSAYVMLHELNAEWPCLSFDIVRDSGAEERTAFPMEGCLVTGTQADRRNKNQLMMLRYTNLHKTQVKDETEEDHEDMESDESEEEEEEEGSTKKDPRHYCIAIPHDGSVNRVRSKNVVSADGGMKNVLTASWSDTGRVHIWDLQSAYNELFAISLDTPSTMLKRSVNPAFSVTKHKTEGFALAWGPLVSGRLISGDCNGQICLTEATSERIETAGETFRGHSDSVEDLQWSPSEATVFASSSVDKTVRIWDIRLPRHQSALSATVHDSDVNVLSWNRHATHMIATGADDGSFATWDLRRWAPNSDGGDALSRFTWHRDAVTSIEWSPHDVSVLAVAGADDQLTIWDFEVEESSGEVLDGRTVPSQLLFIHQGQKEIKELHWHPQLSGVLVSTALSGFNIFKTISV